MYRDIEIFRMVMQTGSTRQAAEKLAISQPAVSQSIRKLEAKAQVSLFERSRGRLIPKSSAYKLLAEVEEVFIGMERIEHRLQSLKSEEASIRIASYPALGNMFLPRVIADFDPIQSNCRIALEVMSSRDVYRAVSNGLFDFGLIADEISIDKLEHSTIFASEGAVVMPKGHPLSSLDLIRAKDLSKYPFIALNPEDQSQKQLSLIMNSIGLELNVIVETPYSLTVCELVRLGIGIGLVNPITAYEFLPMEVCIKKFEYPINFSASLVFQPGYILHKDVSRFIQLIRTRLNSELTSCFS